MEPPLTKILKTSILVEKIKYFVIIHFNKQTVITEVKSKKFNDSVVLAFLEYICYIQTLANRTRISSMCRPIY